MRSFAAAALVPSINKANQAFDVAKGEKGRIVMRFLTLRGRPKDSLAAFLVDLAYPMVSIW